MEKNRNIADDTTSQVNGGISSFENPEEYKYTVLQTIKMQVIAPVAEQLCSA